MHNTDISRTVMGVFAHDRDAMGAIARIVMALDVAITYTKRPYIDRRDQRAVVVVETTFQDPRLAGRIRTLMGDAGGVPLPAGVA